MINSSESNLTLVKKAIVPCLDPEHEPPTHIHLEPGEYQYKCPRYKKAINFTVPHIGQCPATERSDVGSD